MSNSYSLASGEQVVDSNPSHIHVGVTEEILREALAMVCVAPGEDKVKATLDLGRPLGGCNCVLTGPEDEIVFGQRPHRGGLTRFVMNRQPEPTHLVTVSLRLRPDGVYEIGTAYLGGPGHAELWASPPEKRSGAIEFWSRHALCWDYELVIFGTVRSMNSARLVYGSGRFRGVVANNQNFVWVDGYDRPTKLVDARKDVALCLPAGDAWRWGMYPTHQDSWLNLAFVVACHAAHEDEVGLEIRRRAFASIPAVQWPALVAMASQFAREFRERFAQQDLVARKAYKSATRALQDCLLYAAVREFPADQDAFLASSSVANLVAKANQGRAGQLKPEDGLELADAIDALVAQIAECFGGIDTCRKALVDLQDGSGSGRVIILPEGLELERAAELIRTDVVIGVPDAHDMDLVSVVEGQGAPELIQLTDVLSSQRLDIMVVSPELAAGDYLTGGHPAFQSVAEMLLANGTPRTARGEALVQRLQAEVDPLDLAKKYRQVAVDFFSGAHRKSWVSRRADATVAQVKKVIPLYRIACDLLPRAFALEAGRFPGGEDIVQLAQEAGLGEVFTAIRSVLDRQDATDEELDGIASAIKSHMNK